MSEIVGPRSMAEIVTEGVNQTRLIPFGLRIPALIVITVPRIIKGAKVDIKLLIESIKPEHNAFGLVSLAEDMFRRTDVNKNAERFGLDLTQIAQTNSFIRTGVPKNFLI